MPQELKLHLGCGQKKIPGWINIDSVSHCQPDVVHDLAKVLPYEDQSVSEILAEGLLEHFDKYMRLIVFSEWARVLKIGGTIRLGVPDFKKILFRYFKFRFENFVDLIFGENMLASEVYLGHFGNHKWGYSRESLANFVRQFEIEPVSIKTNCLSLELIGRKKKHISKAEIDQINVYSVANDHGLGESRMSFQNIKEKIELFQGQAHFYDERSK